jgi:hypothetical protein
MFILVAESIRKSVHVPISTTNHIGRRYQSVHF